MDSRDKPLTADEHLKFKSIIEYATYTAERRAISEALYKVGSRQGNFVCDAWQRAARRMWR